MSVPQLLEKLIGRIDTLIEKPGLQNDDKATIDAIKEKAQKQIQLVAVP
jgi:ribosome assembly protein YihI (activator of Der GTPase)